MIHKATCASTGGFVMSFNFLWYPFWL